MTCGQDAGHEIHLLHVLPIIEPQITKSSISGGGDFVMTSPDPRSDQAQAGPPASDLCTALLQLSLPTLQLLLNLKSRR